MLPEREILNPGTILQGHRIERFISRGGMGVVYEATQLSLDRRVALKLIDPKLGADQEFRRRFRREAQLAAAIDHPSLLPIYEVVDLAEGELFLTMKLIDGVDLRTHVRQNGALDWRTLLDLLVPIAEALDAAHAAGLVHRDVKPANVLLEHRAAGFWPLVTDFGLAKRIDAREADITMTGQLLGTPGYMAPEQIAGGLVDGRADVYALGALAYFCLTGRAPFERENQHAVLFAQTSEDPPAPSALAEAVPPAMDDLVAHAMRRAPDERPATAGALVSAALERLAGPGGETTAVSKSDDTVVAASSATPRPRLLRSVAVHVALYAPLWAGMYVLGRSL